MSKNLQRAGAILVLAGIVLGTYVSYRNSSKRYVPVIFSTEAMLSGLWRNYKNTFLEKNTFRTLDPSQNSITTSEGQSYTLLRAVWQDDRDTFDKSWKWTQENLQHKNDPLFSWLFGQRSDGTYGVITERGGANSATDADVDIALALLMASGRWQDPSYAQRAKLIVGAIWQQEIVEVQQKPYLAANNLERANSNVILINPSYCAPYAYRIFKSVDPQHDWLGVVDSCYDLLSRSIDAPLGENQMGKLPPDWVLLSRSNAALLSPSPELKTTYGFDALRIPWRISLDTRWNNEPRATALLKKLEALSLDWRSSGSLASVYDHRGKRQSPAEAPAMYGGSIGYFQNTNPDLAKKIYEQKLQSLFNPDTLNWKQPLSYYDSNWSWFGMALYNNALPNLTEKGDSHGT